MLAWTRVELDSIANQELPYRLNWSRLAIWILFPGRPGQSSFSSARSAEVMDDTLNLLRSPGAKPLWFERILVRNLPLSALYIRLQIKCGCNCSACVWTPAWVENVIHCLIQCKTVPRWLYRLLLSSFGFACRRLSSLVLYCGTVLSLVMYQVLIWADVRGSIYRTLLYIFAIFNINSPCL